MENRSAREVFETLRRALEEGDADAARALYSEDVVLVGYSQSRPPSSPLRVEGRSNIEGKLQEVFEGETARRQAGYPSPSWPIMPEVTSSRLSDEVIGDDRF